MNELRIKWIGQGGYALDDGKTAILLDPYLSDLVEKEEGFKRLVEPAFLPEETSADVLLFTHTHIDHLDTDSVKRMPSEKPVFAGPSGGLPILEGIGIPAERYVKLDRGDRAVFGDFQVSAVFADHTEDSVGFIITHGDKTLYFTGDSLYTPRMEAQLDQLKELKIDLLFVCINGRLGNMNVDEAVKLTQKINPAAAIPNHYGMFAENTEDPARYVEKLAGSPVAVHVLDYNREYCCHTLV